MISLEFDMAHETPAEWIKAARDLAASFRDLSNEADAHRRFPHEQQAALTASGLEKILVPEEYGGPGGTYMDQIKVSGILAEGDPCVAQMFHVHGIAVELVNLYADEDLKRELHARVLAESLRWTNAYSELSNKDIFNYSVTLTPVAGGFRLNGKKFYSTGSLGGQEMYVTAVRSDSKQLTMCFVSVDSEGLTIHDDWSGMGQVNTASGTTEFNDVFVPSNRVYDMSVDSPDPSDTFGPFGQLAFSGIHVGIAKNALDDCVSHVRDRVRPWVHSGVDRATDDPYVRHTIGQMSVDVAAAEAIQEWALQELAEAYFNRSAENRARASVAVSAAKAFTTEASLKVTSTLFQVTGSGSTLKKYNLDRHWRNVRTLTLHDPVDYKYRLIGDYQLTGEAPPVTAYT
jgi:alkylation response protein AidB-like acyl-CoA dehydrogenase